jgi:hypothetical protein
VIQGSNLICFLWLCGRHWAQGAASTGRKTVFLPWTGKSGSLLAEFPWPPSFWYCPYWRWEGVGQVPGLKPFSPLKADKGTDRQIDDYLCTLWAQQTQMEGRGGTLRAGSCKGMERG